jgi:GCN5-related N-acetyl-transferase
MSTKFDDPAELMVTRNSSANRFEITIAGHLAKVDYRMSGNRMIITHTEVPEALRGKGIVGCVRSEIRAERRTRSRCGMRLRKPVSQSRCDRIGNRKNIPKSDGDNW